MKETTKEILKLINQGKTANEISDIMGISHKRLFNYLTMIRNKGFDFERKYYDNGEIVYIPKKNINLSNLNGTNIITDKESTNYTTMVISDLHFGSSFEIIGVMDRVFDFCAKNGIHNIICCGDLIDGTFNRTKRRISNPYEQIDYFMKTYPFDKNIITFTLLGDHDYSVLKNTGQDFSKVLENYRHDIVSLGYGVANLYIKNDIILLKHMLDELDETVIECNLSLIGHSHLNKCRFSIDSKRNYIKVPSLSGFNKSTIGLNGLPGALLLNISFNSGCISHVNVNNLIFSDEIYCVNETSFDVKCCKRGEFNNTEDYSKVFKR